MKCWPRSCLHVRVLGRVHQHHAVLVEQALVALDRDLEIAAVLEREPGAAVGQHIGVRGRRRVERGAHALADLAVPRALVLGDVDAGSLPEVELGGVGAGLVAARDEGRALGLDRLAAPATMSLLPLDPGRIALRPDQDEVVVHDADCASRRSPRRRISPPAAWHARTRRRHRRAGRCRAPGRCPAPPPSRRCRSSP